MWFFWEEFKLETVFTHEFIDLTLEARKLYDFEKPQPLKILEPVRLRLPLAILMHLHALSHKEEAAPFHNHA